MGWDYSKAATKTYIKQLQRRAGTLRAAANHCYQDVYAEENSPSD
jgi:hypothetical protein